MATEARSVVSALAMSGADVMIVAAPQLPLCIVRKNISSHFQIQICIQQNTMMGILWTAVLDRVHGHNWNLVHNVRLFWILLRRGLVGYHGFDFLFFFSGIIIQVCAILNYIQKRILVVHS